MSVELIACTGLNYAAIEPRMELDELGSSGEQLIEFAGRACYQSFNKPNESTRSNAAYIANLIAQGHESVLEHASVSFYVTGYSRNMLLELERHRHLSFSVESQRFVDAADGAFVRPPAMSDYRNESMALDEMEVKLLEDAADMYRHVIKALSTLTRKQKREAARAYLPGGMETKFVVTGNLRAWRDVLRKRYSVHADREIAHFATTVLSLLRIEASHVFADFPDEMFD